MISPGSSSRKVVLAGIAYNNAEYLRKVSSGAHNRINHLKECTHQIVTEIKESMLKEGEEQLAVAERASKLCSSNKTEKHVMGLRGNPPADQVQEGAPYYCDVTDGCPVTALGPRHSFQSGIHIISFLIEFILNHL